jgi:hypothetical protein
MEFIRKHKASIRLQTWWRYRAATLVARERKVALHRRRLQARYDDPAGVYALYFEQHGAALRLQRWFASFGLLGILKRRLRARLQAQIQAAKARLIQTMFRRHAAKKLFLRKMRLKAMSELVDIKVLVKVQALARRFITMRRERNRVTKRQVPSVRHRLAVRRRNLPPGAEAAASLTRRESFCFAHLKIGTARNIVRLDRKASMIQKIFRIYRARLRFRLMVANKNGVYAQRIKVWWRAVSCFAAIS